MNTQEITELKELILDIKTFVESQEQIRLNAILSILEKDELQDKEIKALREEMADFRKHLNNGWKEDLIKKITEQMSFSVTKMAETAFETKAQIYNESQKSRIINWKEKIFELLLQVFATGGILWLLADKLIK